MECKKENTDCGVITISYKAISTTPSDHIQLITLTSYWVLFLMQARCHPLGVRGSQYA